MPDLLITLAVFALAGLLVFAAGWCAGYHRGQGAGREEGFAAGCDAGRKAGYREGELAERGRRDSGRGCRDAEALRCVCSGHTREG
ncbi:MAG TPA: hypothetical protein VKE74_03325 [Gemmataceae bacterium]|nr:hypothetical protein [Gemmataceae bacterium]